MQGNVFDATRRTMRHETYLPSRCNYCSRDTFLHVAAKSGTVVKFCRCCANKLNSKEVNAFATYDLIMLFKNMLETELIVAIALSSLRDFREVKVYKICRMQDFIQRKIYTRNLT